MLSPIVSHCLPLSPIVPPTCVPVLDSRSLVSSCLPLSPMVSPHVCLCWMVCPPSRGLPLSPIVSYCLRACLPVLEGVFAFPGSCLPLSPHMCACVGWCVRLPGVLSPLVSPDMRACIGWCVHLPNPHVCLCWMVPPPSRGLVSLCVPSCPLVSHCLFLFPFVGWCVFPRPCLPCLPCLPACLQACQVVFLLVFL